MTSKRRKLVLILLGLIVLAVSASYFTREREPTCKGKPLSYWVVQLCPMDPSSPDAPFAQEAVRHIGTNAIPYLLEWIQYEPPASRPIPETLGALINKMPRTVQHRMPYSVADWVEGFWPLGKAYGAPVAFGILGTTAQPAVPDLEKLLQDRSRTNTCIVAMYCLSALGTNAIPEIIAHLSSPNYRQRESAMLAVTSYPAVRTNAHAVIPHLVQCLTNSETRLRRTAVFTLGCIADTDRSQAALVVPALTNHFCTAVVEAERLAATRALGKCGAQAVAAVPLLIESLDDPSNDIRIEITNALMKIAPKVLTNAPPQ